MAKARLKLVTPATKKRAVTPRRQPNSELRSRRGRCRVACVNRRLPRMRFGVAQRTWGKFDQHQFGQFFLLCRATFMGLENQHYQYRLGLLDRDAYAGYKTTIKEQIAAFPGIRAMWQLVRHGYSKDFVAFMDEQISAVPRAHALGAHVAEGLGGII
jgi:hypothetical protein